ERNGNRETTATSTLRHGLAELAGGNDVEHSSEVPNLGLESLRRYGGDEARLRRAVGDAVIRDGQSDPPSGPADRTLPNPGPRASKNALHGTSQPSGRARSAQLSRPGVLGGTFS